MTMRHLRTSFSLPPGSLPGPVVRSLLQRTFGEYQWFRPTRYGFALLDGIPDPDRIDYDALVGFYEKRQVLMLTTDSEEDHFFLSTRTPGAFPHAGRLNWSTPMREELPHLHATHAQQVLEFMRLTGAVLVQSGITEDFDRKTLRLIPDPDGFGSTETFTVRDPSEGLAGLYWRNFFGPPFVRLFGDRLLSLPPDTLQELGDGRVLVQPYPLPTQALTPEGTDTEQRLITVLGPECFYDHTHHRKPTRLPDLSTASP